MNQSLLCFKLYGLGIDEGVWGLADVYASDFFQLK